MKIVKLTESQFLVSNDGENQIYNWQGLLTFLDDICEHLDERTIDSILTELASYSNGASLDL